MSRPKRRQIVQFTPEQEAEFEKRTKDYLTTSNNSTLVSRGRRQNQHLKKRSEEGAAKTAAWAKDHPVLNTLGLATAATPFTVASYPGAVVGGELLGTALTNPYVDAGLTSVFGAHGLNHAINEGITDWKDAAMTTLEVTPLGRLAKPLYEGVVQPGMRLFNSPLTGNWTKIGNREYRLSPNSFGANGSPIESRKVGEYSTDIDLNKMRGVFEDYEKGLTQYKGSKLPNLLEYNYEPPKIKIDFDNLIKDDFVDYLSQQTGRKIKRIPYKSTKDGDIYKEGFSFVDENGKEIAHIAGNLKGKNVWVESSYIDPEFRHQGLGKQMYFDFNDRVFNTYGTTLHSDPYQRLGSIPGEGMSPSNRLWLGLRKNNLSTVEGKGLNQYDVMAEPSQITTVYRTPQITSENATSITPEQWTAAQDAAIARGDMVEALRLSDLHSDIAAKREGLTVYNTYRSQKPNNKYKWEGKSPYDDSRYGIGKSSGYFSTDSEPVARTYKYTDDSPLFNLNVYMKNPYIKDVEGRSWQFADTRIAPNGIKYGVTTDEIINKIKPEGVYDGVIFKNIVDVGAFRRNLNGASDVATDYISFPGRAKLRDAVTYDDNGVRIPLGDRHNFNINDIRYGLLPFLGLGTVSALYKKKQGGKMNILQLLKNGSGIHIKKKNRGKFTEYCGGKVTDACIKRAKASGNPTLVKRATFAANARKWKHKNGGILFAQEGATFGLKVNNFLNSDTGKFAINLGSTLANSVLKTINDSKLKLKLLDWKNAYVNAVTPEDFSNLIEAEESQKQLSNPDYNSSPIEMRHRAYELEQQALAKAKQLRALEADLYIALMLLNNQSSNEGGFGSLLSQGLGLVGLYLSNKTPNTDVTTKTNISFTPTKDYMFNKDLRDKVNNKFASNFYNWTYTEKGDS